MFILSATFMMAGIALGTAFRLYQLKTTPITPVAPGFSKASGGDIDQKVSCDLLTIPLSTPEASPSTSPAASPSVSPSASPSTSPSPTGETAQCLDIKVFSTNWVQYTDLSQAFKAGTTVRFTIGANVTTGEIQKARFYLNGADMGETTLKRAGTDEFYYEYTIPEGVNQILIEAEVYHSTLGWF